MSSFAMKWTSCLSPFSPKAMRTRTQNGLRKQVHFDESNERANFEGDNEKMH